MLVNKIQQSMKEQMIVVRLQSQTTCLCILHYHLQQSTLILSYQVELQKLLLKNLPSQGCHLLFHNCFYAVVFCMGRTFFYSWLFLG